MTRGSDAITVQIDGQTFTFDSVEDLIERTNTFAESVKRDWDDRRDDLPVAEALALLIRRSEVVAVLSAAGLQHLEQKRALADAAIAEINRLLGEL